MELEAAERCGGQPERSIHIYTIPRFLLLSSYIATLLPSYPVVFPLPLAILFAASSRFHLHWFSLPA